MSLKLVNLTLHVQFPRDWKLNALICSLFPSFGAGLDLEKIKLRAFYVFLLLSMASQISNLVLCFLMILLLNTLPQLLNGRQWSLPSVHTRTHTHPHTQTQTFCLWFHHSLVVSIAECPEEASMLQYVKCVAFSTSFVPCYHLFYSTICSIFHLGPLTSPVNKSFTCFNGLFPEHTGWESKI